MDLILVGSTPGTLAVRKTTATIPIVMVTTGDPVADGIVPSLARPGGNVTGVTALATALNGKRVELLKEAVPGVTRVAVLANPTAPYTQPFMRERDAVARALGLAARRRGARPGHAGARIRHHDRRARGRTDGLMFYGASLADMYHHAAVYADRILKGTKPADLPIEQPTKLELVINLKAARSLGLTMPRSILAKADHLIE